MDLDDYHYDLSDDLSPSPLSPAASISSTSSSSSESGDESVAADTTAGPANIYADGQPQASPAPVETVTCMWADCGTQFDDLQPLISHVHGGWAFSRLYYEMRRGG